MIDPSGRIDNELSNIIGTVARANPKLKLEVASIALICFPGLLVFPPCYNLQIYLCGPSVRVDEKTKKNWLIC
jgi:hypothetical protein